MALVQRIRALFRLFVLFTVLVAVALISAITTIRLTIHSGQENMPDFTGASLAEAQRRAALMGLGVKIEDHVYSEKYPADHIISQIPAPGTRVKAGQDVHVLVSLGRPHITVPDLIGSSVRAAEITAMQRGLALGDVAKIHWTGAAADQVVSQEPPPATTDVRSPAVNLLVSAGDATPAFVCPSFIGMNIAEARRIAASAGFKVGTVTPINIAPGNSAGLPATGGKSLPSGTILIQRPPAGSKIAPDTVLEFQIAP